MRVRQSVAVAAAASAAGASAVSLKDIKHIILFMQENRSFDHYFGTMAGVRGFGDANVQVNSDGLSTLQQPISPAQNGSNWLQPWHINYQGGDWANATQCGGAGSNGWDAMHQAWANGEYNAWVDADTPWSLAYFNREDIPTHFDIVEGWTILDNNHQATLAPTDPNRCFWMSGTINVPGSPANPNGTGGAMIDNTASPGCDIEAPVVANCWPFTWSTFPEVLEDAGVSWQVWQDFDDFEDNMLEYFEQYRNAANDSALRVKGASYPGMDAFYAAAAAGTLPQVSYIIGPQELSEHPPNMPKDGAWFQQQVVDAVINSPAYKETVLIISYDEQGGWADHVAPIIASQDTPGEWMQDPYQEFGWTPVGPGPRVPRYIISPFTRGGNVFSEYSDHTSDIMFVEAWAEANGYNVHSPQLTQWRREHMSNLVNALDFENPDYSLPHITPAAQAAMKPNSSSDYSGDFSIGSLTGPWVGPADCLSDYSETVPPVPYGPANANQDLSLLVEEGFKRVRGQLSEGHFLTFEIIGLALTNLDGLFVTVSPATSTHQNINQRWIVHYSGDALTTTNFLIQSAADNKYISALGLLTSSAAEAQAFTFKYNPAGATYSITPASERGFSLLSLLSDLLGAALGEFSIYSVSYH